MPRAPFAYRLATTYGLPLIVFALLWGILQGPYSALNSTAGDQLSTSAGSDGLQYAQQAWNYAPLFVLLGLGAAIVAAALFRSRR